MTHAGFAKSQALAVPCSASHMGYGGRCLNCGYQPTNNGGHMSKPKRIPNRIHGELAHARYTLLLAINELTADVETITDILEGVEDGDVRQCIAELVTQHNDVVMAMHEFRHAVLKNVQ
jgi:hypothetical protein